MSVDIKITTNERKLSAKLKKKTGMITPQLRIGMRDILQKLRAQEQRDLSSGNYGLKTRSGILRNSLAIEILDRGDSIVGLMGTNLPYAPAHEFGTTIKSKSGKYLTIPFKGIKGRALEYANTFFAKSRNNNLILFQKTGPSSIRPLFVLKESVQVRKKKWMSKSFLAIKSELLKTLRATIRQAVMA